MRKMLGIALAALILLTGCQSTESLRSTVTVNGHASVALSPDMAQFDVAVSETASTSREAQKLTAVKVRQVLDVLSAAGVAEKDISTESLSLSSAYEWKNNNREYVGQNSTQVLEVKIRDIESLASVLDSLGEIDAIRIDSISFDASDKSGAYRSAREQAVKDAASRADTYLLALGMNRGEALALSETGTSTPVVYRKSAMMMEASSDGNSVTPVGDLEVGSNVTITFAIEQ